MSSIKADIDGLIGYSSATVRNSIEKLRTFSHFHKLWHLLLIYQGLTSIEKQRSLKDGCSCNKSDNA